MQVFAVLFLAAAALARPEAHNHGAVTTVTERTFIIRGDGSANSVADKYYSAGSSNYGSSSGSVSGVSSYSNGASGVSSYSAPAQESYKYQVGQAVGSSVPVGQQSYYKQYESVSTAAPVAQQQSYYKQYEATASAAPAVSSYQAASYQAAAPVYAYQTAAPAVAYQAASYQAAAPVYAYQAAAPAVAYQAAAYQAAAPAYAYQAAAPAYSYQAVTAAPAVAYKAVASSVAAPAYQAQQAHQVHHAHQAHQATVGQRVESNYDYNNYESNVQQTQASGETKVFKHVYAFAAPEEPATRARISVQAPVSKSKHYKLVFIKAPTQQTIVDSDVVLPAQQEEKTLIYLLSKDAKQVQPEIRIKQAEASKHAKPEVFFLKYKNEQEAQAIANGAISGQTADVPSNGEIISDGSVSILGQSSGQSFGSSSGSSSGSSFGQSAFGSNFGQSSFGSGSNFASDNVYRSGAVNSGASNVAYRSEYSSGNSGVSSGVSSGISSGVSSGVSSGINSAALVSDVAVSPASSSYTSGSRSGFSFGAGSSGAASGSSFGVSSGSAGQSSGFSAYSQEPTNVAVKVSSQSAEYSAETATAGPL